MTNSPRKNGTSSSHGTVRIRAEVDPRERVGKALVPAGERRVVVGDVHHVPAEHDVAEAESAFDRRVELVLVDVLAAQDAVDVGDGDLDAVARGLADGGDDLVAGMGFGMRLLRDAGLARAFCGARGRAGNRSGSAILAQRGFRRPGWHNAVHDADRPPSAECRRGTRLRRCTPRCSLFGFAGLFGKWLDLSPVAIVLGRTAVAAAALGIVLLAHARGAAPVRACASSPTASCWRCTG